MRVASPLAGPYAAWMPRPRKNLHGRICSVSRDGRRARPPAASLQISRLQPTHPQRPISSRADREPAPQRRLDTHKPH
ncbi:hypothetical protein XarbCFBP7614_03400 [Xanthomonas arboricola]|nr:hypothetical protein XarbCFBP7614_03400 [Xanthomonas arboricola]